jgi:hypothetical protein
MVRGMSSALSGWSSSGRRETGESRAAADGCHPAVAGLGPALGALVIRQGAHRRAPLWGLTLGRLPWLGQPFGLFSCYKMMSKPKSLAMTVTRCQALAHHRRNPSVENPYDKDAPMPITCGFDTFDLAVVRLPRDLRRQRGAGETSCQAG